MTRPRAADDFAAIRARMEELGRERADIQGEATETSHSWPRSSRRPAQSDTEQKDLRRVPRTIVGRYRRI
jgi:hypothetical protein